MSLLSYLVVLIFTNSVVSFDTCRWIDTFSNAAACARWDDICPYDQADDLWRWNETSPSVPQITSRFDSTRVQLVLQSEWTISTDVALFPANYTLVVHVLPNIAGNSSCDPPLPPDVFQVYFDENQILPMTCIPTNKAYGSCAWLECLTVVPITTTSQTLHLQSLIVANSSSSGAAIRLITLCDTSANELWFYADHISTQIISLGDLHENCEYCGSQNYVCSNETAWNNGSIAEAQIYVEGDVRRYQFSMSFVAVGEDVPGSVTVDIGGNAVSFSPGGTQNSCGDCRSYTSEKMFWLAYQVWGNTPIKVTSDQPICISSIDLTIFASNLATSSEDYEGDDDGCPEWDPKCYEDPAYVRKQILIGVGIAIGVIVAFAGVMVFRTCTEYRRIRKIKYGPLDCKWYDPDDDEKEAKKREEDWKHLNEQDI